MIWANRVVSLRTILCAILCVIVLFTVTPAFTQGSTGSVSGQVTDQTGAVVPGASVTLTDASTHNSRTTTSNETGRYVFVSIDPGSYDITVNAKGFAVAKLPSLKVQVGQVLNANVSLQVGAATETVEVTATGTELQTTNATVGTSMSFDMARAMPALSRDVSGLALLQPAVGPASDKTSGNAGATAGSNADQNQFMLDGGNNSNDMDGVGTVYLSSFAGNPITGSGAATPNGVVPTPLDSVEEFKVGVTNQGADFNAAAGSQVSVATRRGGNAWHGTGYDYFYPSTVAANSWSNGHTPSTDPSTKQLRYFTPNPARHYNKFGASAGGPIAPNFLGGKTYLFAFYQGWRFTNSSILEKPVPSDLLRAGVIQVQNSSSGPIVLNGTSYAKGAWMPFNLNPTAVTVNGTTYPSATVCGSGGNLPCDPRGLGLNPIVNQIWSKWMPKGNDPSGGDQFNTIGYSGSVALPQKDNNWVFRLDHDFGSKNHFFSSYRYYKTSVPSTNQVDVGGLLAGGQAGTYNVTRSIPQVPSFLVAGFTSQLKSNVTNDFHWSWTRNWWAWSTQGAPAQPISGLGGAVEIGNGSANPESTSALIPYNVDTQDVRTRFWDGMDNMFRDDVTWLHGNHLLTFGGTYQRNFNFHDRNDNGQGIMAANVYQLGLATASNVNWASILPPGTILPSAQVSSWEGWYADVLGMVTQAQSLYTRSGSDLHLLPLGTHAQDKSVIPYYQGYVSDSWKVKPNFTLTYGMSYTLELPPFEQQGRQVMLVDQADNPVVFSDYINQRQQAALKGQVYNPVIGFATVPNVGGGRKYPYDTFYGGWSPRLAAAWNPHFNDGFMKTLLGDGNTVVRGGYARIYGRLNGVDLVLVPLLGTGLMQAVQCNGVVMASAAVNGSQCLSTGSSPANNFRIGTDGLVAPLGVAPSNTLPQPFFPGTPIGNTVGGINATAASGSVLDPKFRPNSNDSFSFSVQREISPKMFMEVGYIGKLIHNEFQEIATEGVPYMTTLGGQSFAKAFGQMYTQMCGLNVQVCTPNVNAVTAQPFFETALGGPNSAYCKGFASCTAAVASKQSGSIAANAVFNLWANLNSQTSWILPNSLYTNNPASGCPSGAAITPSTVCAQAASIQWNTSIGYGNYHAVYGSFTFRDFHGLTARSNFTWGRALGTGSEVQARSTRTDLDPFNVRANYGPQSFDVKFVYNLAMSYAPNVYKSQAGIVGHLLGGWSFAPIFTAQSGFPLDVTQSESNCTDCQAFGATNGNASAIYSAQLVNGKFNGGNSLNYFNASPAGTVGTTATAKAPNGASTEWLNMFGNPASAYGQFRRLILGVDTNGGAFGVIRGFSRWNVDGSILKDIRVTERVGMTFSTQFTNIFNHMQPSDPSLALNSPATFGRVSGTAYDARQVEFGLHLKW